MSEAMAVEALLLRLWELDGFFGRNRGHFNSGRTWREIDAIAMSVERDGRVTVRFGEVKSRGTADQLYTVPAVPTAEWLGPWDGFMSAFAALYAGDVACLKGLPRWQNANAEVWFVFNGLFEDGEAKQRLEAALKQDIARRMNYAQRNPQALSTLRVRVETTKTIVMQCIEKVHEALGDGRGARFGDPFLDAVRELFRYRNAPSESAIEDLTSVLNNGR